MKVRSVILGFQYKGKIELPAILIDIYRIYSFCKDMDRLVLTDISRDKKAQELSKGLTGENSDPNIFSFIRTSKEATELFSWENMETMKKYIQNHVFQSDRVFFYYTGHATVGNLLLPDGSSISSVLLLQWMTEVVQPACEFVFLLDCCHASSLQLPFRMTMDYRVSRYRSTAMQKGGIYHLVSGDVLFQKHRVLCLCSALEDEDSMISWTGSTFTHLLLRELEESSERNMHDLLMRIQEVMRSKQTCRAYASYPDLIALPAWLFCSSLLSLRYSDGGILVTKV